MGHRDDNHGVEILVSFLIGSIVGAGMAMLLTPQSGKKTRAQIRDMAEDATDYAKKLKGRIL
jgi:gas vesicle protein